MCGSGPVTQQLHLSKAALQTLRIIYGPPLACTPNSPPRFSRLPLPAGGVLVAMSGNLVSALNTEIIIPLYQFPDTECEV